MQGRTGHLDVLEKSTAVGLAGSSSKKKCKIKWCWRPTKGGANANYFAYNKPKLTRRRAGSWWQAKDVKIKAVGRSEIEKSKPLHHVTFARIFHYTQHVAYNVSTIVKSQVRASTAMFHSALSGMNIPFIHKETAAILQRVTFESYWVRK